MVDIQSPTAEIRREKIDIKKKKEEETTRRKYNGPPYCIWAAIKKKKIKTTGVKYNGLPITVGGHKN